MSRFASVFSAAALAAACVGFATPGQLSAAASNVVYKASGTFATTVVSGSDPLKLAGKPFTISITASESAVPVKTGTSYASYNKLAVTGSLGGTVVTLSGKSASLELAFGNPAYDVVALFVPEQKAGSVYINIGGSMQAPPGTFTTYKIGPFTAPVTLGPTTTVITYGDKSGSTTLAIATGMLTTTVQ